MDIREFDWEKVTSVTAPIPAGRRGDAPLSTPIIPVSGVLTRALGPSLISSACQLFDARGLAKLVLMAQEIESLNRAVLSRPLSNAAERNDLTELRARWKIAFRELEALRGEWVGPLNDRVHGINAVFARIKDPGLAFDQNAERALLAYLNAERDRERRERDEQDRKLHEAAEAQARAEAEAVRATTDKARALANAAAEAASQQLQAVEAVAPRAAATRVRTDSGSTFVQRRKVVRIVSPELVPREWCIPNEPAIKKAALAGVAIPGVAVEEVEGLSMRVS